MTGLAAALWARAHKAIEWRRKRPVLPQYGVLSHYPFGSKPVKPIGF